MTTRAVSVKLQADVGNYLSGMRQATSATKDLGSVTLQEAQKNKQAFQTVGLSLTAIGVAAGVGVAMVVKRFADFDQAMSNVQAATHASAGAMDDLREAALEAGARTAFSAVEAADGIEALAKAGVSTTAILNGGLNGALDLAAAGGLAVGDAAEIAATALTQFKLQGSQVPHVADLLAAAAGKAQGDVSDMGMALKQAGLVASQAGLTIEETTAGLAAFASAGLLGSDAGTSFKAALQRLTPQSAEAQRVMDELGISAYDAQGNFVGLEKFAGILQDSLKGLTVEQRNSAMATIFGSDAVRAASVLYSQGSEGIAAWTDKVNDAGYAQETASIKLDNLKGDVEEFSGSVETAFIKTGEAGDGLARASVQGATAVVNAYSDLPAAAQGVTLGLGGIVAAAASVSGGFLLLAPRISDTREALRTLRDEAPNTTRALQGIGKAAGIAGIVLTAATAWNALTNAMAEAQMEAAPAVGALTRSLSDFLRTGKTTGELANVVGDDFSHLAATMRRAGESGNVLVSGWLRGKNIKEAQADVLALDQALTGMVSAGHIEQATAFFNEMAMAAAADGVSVQTLRERLPEYTDAVEAAAAETALAADAQGEMGGAVDGATGAVQTQTESLAELMDKVRALSEQVLGLRGSERSYEAAIDDATEALKDNGATLDISTTKGRDNEAALDGIATSANDVLEAMVASGQPIESVTAKMQVQREALIRAAIGFGMSEEAANTYADQVLRIPPAASTTVSVHGADTALGKIEAFRTAIANIPSLKDVTVRYNETTGIQVRRPGGGALIERASGGYYPGGGPMLVGERGPELLFPDIGGFVLNNRATLEAMNGLRAGWIGGSAPTAPQSAAPSVDRSIRDNQIHLHGTDATPAGLMRELAWL